MLGTALGIAAWGLVTGVAMGKSGMPLPLMVLMSLLVFAGSAQLAVLPLMTTGAPIWVIWVTALCVNLRFVIFSAQWRPYLIGFRLRKRLWLSYFTADLNYVMFMRRFPEPRPGPEQMPYFWGGVVTNWFAWQVPSLVGIFAAEAVPVHWGIGFAGTLALLGLACALLADRATAVAGAVAGCAAVAAYALPLKCTASEAEHRGGDCSRGCHRPADRSQRAAQPCAGAGQDMSAARPSPTVKGRA